MKKIQTILLFTYSILLAGSSAFAANEDTPYEENKTIHKAFKITDRLELDIISKYGDVTIDTWDKDSVSFDISIKVITDNPVTSKEFIKDVTVIFDKTDDYISAITEWNRYTNQIRKTAIDFATILGRERKIEVNYNIKLPANSEINIINSFGDINLNNHSGELKLEASHGDIRMRKVDNIKKLKLSYGKLKIKEFNKASIEVHSCNVDIESAKDLSLETTSSDVEIDEIDVLRISSKHDKVELGKVKEFIVSASWSDIDIEHLEETIRGEIKYGDLTVDKIAASFREVDIIGHATDLELNFPEKVAFAYDVSLENGKRFSIPSNGNTTDKTDSYGEFKIYKGTFATIPIGGEPAQVIIKAKASYVDIRLAD